MSPEQIAIFLTCFVALMAPVLDFKFKKVPTWFSVPALGIGLGVASTYGWQGDFSIGSMMTSFHAEMNFNQVIFAMMFVGLIFGVLAWRGGISKEDLYLLLAIVSFNSFQDSMHILVYTTFAGFLIAIFYVVYKGMFKELLGALGRSFTFQGKKRDDEGKVADIHKLTIPYSPAIACGAFFWVVMS